MLTASKARERCLPKLRETMQAYFQLVLDEIDESGGMSLSHRLPAFAAGYVAKKLRDLDFEVEERATGELHIVWLRPEDVSGLVLALEASGPRVNIQVGNVGVGVAQICEMIDAMAQPPSKAATPLAHCPCCRRVHDQVRYGQAWRHQYSQKLFVIDREGYGVEWTTGDRTTKPVNGRDQDWSYVAPSVQNAVERGVLSPTTCYAWDRWAGLGG